MPCRGQTLCLLLPADHLQPNVPACTPARTSLQATGEKLLDYSQEELTQRGKIRRSKFDFNKFQREFILEERDDEGAALVRKSDRKVRSLAWPGHLAVRRKLGARVMPCPPRPSCHARHAQVAGLVGAVSGLLQVIRTLTADEHGIYKRNPHIQQVFVNGRDFIRRDFSSDDRCAAAAATAAVAVGPTPTLALSRTKRLVAVQRGLAVVAAAAAVPTAAGRSEDG